MFLFDTLGVCITKYKIYLNEYLDFNYDDSSASWGKKYCYIYKDYNCRGRRIKITYKCYDLKDLWKQEAL